MRQIFKMFLYGIVPSVTSNVEFHSFLLRHTRQHKEHFSTLDQFENFLTIIKITSYLSMLEIENKDKKTVLRKEVHL